MAATEIRLNSGALSAVISTMGAELRSYTHAGRELLWQADPVFWDQTSPLLFPICGRAIGNRVTVGGRDYPMTIHGFAMTSAFRVLETRADFCRLELVPDDASRAQYPFDFRLQQDYQLEGQRLWLRSRVENTGTRPMPFSFGYHPGLSLPLPGLKDQPHEVWLGNDAEPPAEEQRENFLTGGQIPSPFTRGRLAVTDASFFPSSSIITAGGAGQVLFYGTPERSLMITWQGLENLVLWRPQGAGFLCVEPWQGLPTRIGAGSELAARPFSLTLAPGEGRDFEMGIHIHSLAGGPDMAATRAD